MDTEILIVLAILAATMILLGFELFRIDVAAILCMLALGWSGVVEPGEALSGFSSNAVVAMMGVMIMGHGIERTGIMDRFSAALAAKAGTGRRKIIGWMSLSIGAVSGLIQNIGAAALFLPAIRGISRRENIPPPALIMPIGFAAILGGTLTMVGSGPLILVNDLLRGASLEPYGLFSVTPVGILLLLAGIGYFSFFGKHVLPETGNRGDAASDQEKLKRALQLPERIEQFAIPTGSPLIGKTTEQSGAWDDYRLNILGLSRGSDIEYSPWRGSKFEAGQELALLGNGKNIQEFASAYRLVRRERSERFENLHHPDRAGFAEVILPPRSQMIGQSLRQLSLRRRHAVEPVLLFSRGEEIRGDFSDHPLLPGDILVVYGLWENMSDLKESTDFVVSTPFPAEKRDESKSRPAILCFAAAIGLAVTGSPISMAFFTGAAAMVLLRVLSIQEAYRAIEWKVVFLLAGLIPLGVAMQKTGTAEFLAGNVMRGIEGAHPIVLLGTVAVLSTAFSLFMSNVGAIVVLAPLVIGMAEIGGMDPRPLALMAAVCAANSFILPTHQVNALLMTAGGYRNADYLKAGGGMTLIFIAVVVTAFYLFFI